MAGLVPIDHDPFASDAPAAPDVVPVDHDPFAIGNPMGEVYPPQGGNAVRDLARGVADYVKTPGSLMKANPYPAGSEEAQWYENAKSDMEAGFGASTALNTMGTGVIAGVPARAGETVLGAGGIRAYHGSPHDFDRFDLSKIGTGEGAQSYGHGLYFAENEGVAASYRDQLSSALKAPQQEIQAAVGDAIPFTPQLSNAIRSAAMDKMTPERAALAIQSRIPELRDGGNMLDMGPKRQALAAAIQKARDLGQGRMYEVDINAHPDHFLDWDKPLAEQSQHVQDALINSGVTIPKAPQLSTISDPAIRGIVRKALAQNEGQAQNLGMIVDNDLPLYRSALQHAKNRGRDLEHEDVRAGDYVEENAKTFLEALNHSQNSTAAEVMQRAYKNPRHGGDLIGKDMAMPEEVSAGLRAAGIRGIKYLDQGSRTSGAGSSNYVLFDDKLVSILRKYGIAGLAALPPAVAAEYKNRLQPVDHDPFVE